MKRAGQVFAPKPVPADAGVAALIDREDVFEAAWTDDFAVDGSFAPARWQAATAVTRFGAVRSGAQIPNKTDLRLMYSTTALYVGGRCWQDMSKLTARYDQDDQPIFNDDNVEMFFYLGDSASPYMIQVAVNANGNFYDSRDGRTSHETGMTLKARRLADGWTFEAKIPFAGLGIESPFPGEAIPARFIRRVTNPFASGAVPYLKTTGNGPRKGFGKLRFGANPKGDARAIAQRRQAREAKLFDDRRTVTTRRLAEMEGSTAAFRLSEHPAYCRAVQAAAQMREATDAYEKGKKDAAARTAYLETAEGFDDYVSRNGYLVWPTDPWSYGSPEELPPNRPQDAPTLKFRQAGNEKEAICLAFTGLLSGKALDLRIVPQSVDTKKQFVSCDSFEVYEEPFVRQEKDVITAPLCHMPGNIVTLVPGKITRVWVVFNSRGVEPGEYRTRILLKPAYDSSYAVRELPVEMTVWNFTLPETRDWPVKSFLWGPNQFRNDEAQALRLAWDHHVTHGWTKSALYEFGLRRERSRIRPEKGDDRFFDRRLAETANEEFFRTAKDLGMRFVFGWGTPDRTPEWFQVMEKRLRGMGFEYEDFVFKTLVRDEFAKADIPKYADRRAATRAASTNWYFQCVYLSTPPPTGATMDDIEAAKLPEFYRMFTVIRGLLNDPKRGPDVYRRLKSKGCQVWSYECALYMQRRGILRYYRLYPWEAMLKELDGIAIWCSGTREGDDGFDTSDGYDDGICWCDGKRYVPTKRYEAFREGLEDAAYMDRLAKELARVGASRFPAFRKLLDERKGIFDRANQDEVDAWRLAVGEAIDKLTRTR